MIDGGEVDAQHTPRAKRKAARKMEDWSKETNHGWTIRMLKNGKNSNGSSVAEDSRSVNAAAADTKERRSQGDQNLETKGKEEKEKDGTAGQDKRSAVQVQLTGFEANEGEVERVRERINVKVVVESEKGDDEEQTGIPSWRQLREPNRGRRSMSCNAMNAIYLDPTQPNSTSSRDGPRKKHQNS
ncbi:hypothetical protein TWF506_007773 [Arthrobotrys conoides]|uniref:Uncharacterized protein n=1 Tax=Arthrobotrys conoides TaxID=74498 RepID=A0AAN8NRX4_9PEZI